MSAVSFDSEVKLELKIYSTFETGRMMECAISFSQAM